jgi:NAD(P)H-dependent FMN reductase
MSMTIKIHALSGSRRRRSYNHGVLDFSDHGAFEAEAEVKTIHLADFKLALCDADQETEHGSPDGARILQELVAEHDALLIAPQEYNREYTTLLTNATDRRTVPVRTTLRGDSAVSRTGNLVERFLKLIKHFHPVSARCDNGQVVGGKHR